jgi:hypothetical protein
LLRATEDLKEFPISPLRRLLLPLLKTSREVAIPTAIPKALILLPQQTQQPSDVHSGGLSKALALALNRLHRLMDRARIATDFLTNLAATLCEPSLQDTGNSPHH